MTFPTNHPLPLPAGTTVSGGTPPQAENDQWFIARSDKPIAPFVAVPRGAPIPDDIRSALLTTRAPATPSPIRVFHRQPNAPSSDRNAPRLVDLDEYMAIQPVALERAFFGLFAMEDEKPYDMDGSVAIVSIDGPLMQRGGWWYDGYQSIRERFGKALDDRAVTAVVLKINSPGGVCAGCFSAARSMRAMKVEAGKPVLAYADESAYSAAYAMACIADEIYLPPEGGVGSVGVIGTLEDWTAYNERVGIKVAVITSGEYKADGHPDVPMTPAVVARYQARIDQLARSFAEVVGGARGMTPEAVLKLEAACLYGEEAVKAGLANGVATLEATVANAQTKGIATSKTRTRPTIGSAGATKGHAMTIPNKAGSADQNSQVLEGVAFGELVASHAEFALAAGLPHDASKGDVLAKLAEQRGAVVAATNIAKELLDAIVGKDTSAGGVDYKAAIGQLSAERATQTEIVKAITGDEQSTAQDAIAKLAADRKSAELVEAKALVEQAAASGKTAGPKALELFEKHGMGALKAHLEALVPHAALTATAPTQKQEPGGTKPADAQGDDVVLSEDDKRFCKKNGIDEKAFLETRKAELAERRENERKHNS